MGAIRDVIASVDRAKPELDEQTAHIDALSDLAQAKADLFEEQLKERVVNAGTGTDRTIPISQVLAFKKETHAYSSNNADLIPGAVSDAISGFVEGGTENVLNGVSKLLSTAVTALLGSSSAGEAYRDEYYIVNEGIALTRLDFMGWRRKVTAKSLTERVEAVSAFTICKSVVDMHKVNFDTFVNKYQAVLKADNPTLTTAQLIQECRETFSLYQDNYVRALQVTTPNALAVV